MQQHAGGLIGLIEYGLEWLQQILHQYAAWLPGMRQITAVPFLFLPWLLLMALGCVAGYVSVLVNLRSVEFQAETMVHAVFPGIVIGAIVAGVQGIVWAGMLTCILIASIFGLFGRTRHHSEAFSAIVLSGFFAVGMVISLKHRDMSGQLEALMFGRLLTVTPNQLAQSLALCMVACALAALTLRRQVYVAFDPIAAQASGVRVKILDISLNLAIAMLIVAASTAIGVLLAIGYAVIPGVSARLIVKSYRAMAPVAVGIGCVAGHVGLMLAMSRTPRPLSAQASVAFALVAAFMLSMIWQWVRGERHER